jgi:hypothetical protein
MVMLFKILRNKFNLKFFVDWWQWILLNLIIHHVIFQKIKWIVNRNSINIVNKDVEEFSLIDKIRLYILTHYNVGILKHGILI